VLFTGSICTSENTEVRLPAQKVGQRKEAGRAKGGLDCRLAFAQCSYGVLLSMQVGMSG
jgi:hypothetical protein